MMKNRKKQCLNKSKQVKLLIFLMCERCLLLGDYDFDEQFWSGISDSVKDLISKLLTVDPQKRCDCHFSWISIDFFRLTVSEALQHPWVKNTHNNKEEKTEIATEDLNKRKREEDDEEINGTNKKSRK